MKIVFNCLFTFIFLSTIVTAQNLNIRLIKTNTENFPYLVSAVQVYDNNEDPIVDRSEERRVGKECRSR